MKSEKRWEYSRFKFKLLAGKFWILGTLGTRKKETERNREVRKRAGKFRIQIQTVGGKVFVSRDAGDAKKRDREKWRSSETLGTLWTQKKEIERNREVRK